MTDKKKISVSHGMKKGILDDDYTLYEDGTVLHFYDKSTYPGGQNFEETLNGRELSEVVKKRLLDSASEENKLLVKELLNIQEE